MEEIQYIDFISYINITDVCTQNQTAMKLYQSLGFRPYKWITDYYSRGSNNNNPNEDILKKDALYLIAEINTDSLYV